MLFEDVVSEEQYMLKAYIGSFGVRSGEVDDIAQRSFLLLYQKWDTLEENSNYGAFLRTLAKGLIRNEISKQANRKSLIDKNMTTLMLDHEEESPLETLLSGETHSEEQHALEECLKKLQGNMTRILRARYWEGKNSSEIAAIEGKSPSAIRKILMKIKGTLRDCITSV